MSADPADEVRRLAALEGRVAFGVVAFALAGALVALVDRVGAPEQVVVALGPAVLVGGLIAIGVVVNAMRISAFYAAGRGAPASYAGLAAAGVAAGLLLPVAVAPRADGILPQVLAAAFVGLAGAGLLVGPLLRKTGAYSLTDLIAARFPDPLVRFVVAAGVAVASCLAALAAYEAALRAAQDTLGFSRAASTVLGAVVVVAIVGPGGAAGVIWGLGGGAGRAGGRAGAHPGVGLVEHRRPAAAGRRRARAMARGAGAHGGLEPRRQGARHRARLHRHAGLRHRPRMSRAAAHAGHRRP